MRLPKELLTVDQKVEEFNSWLTPQLHEIKGTEKFQTELAAIDTAISSLALKLNGFEDIEDCSLVAVRDAAIEICLELISDSKVNDAETEMSVITFLSSFFSMLFLVTGATDNNLKNHFTIKLRQDGVLPCFPERTGKVNVRFKLKPFGHTVKSDDVAAKIGRAIVAYTNPAHRESASRSGIDLKESSELLLFEYIGLIMASRDDVRQFWVICLSYMRLKSMADEAALSLITPSVIFKVRGSVSATAGHLPEKILREKLQLIGLEPGVDFNLTDVVIGVEEVVEEGERKRKTRAYDFIIPYAREGWGQHLFIQAQFYAGDSGSVSHKVVDQTLSSRRFTKQRYPEARFVEYLDGAGYFASLRGDLIHMMRMKDTHSFIQVRSLWVRLRRELQLIGFITPVEIEHAILRTEQSRMDQVKEILYKEGYAAVEVERSISYALDKGFFLNSGGILSMKPERKPLARRLLIVDTIACYGKVLLSMDEVKRSVSIPGYGPSFGMIGSELAKLFYGLVKSENITAPDYVSDIEWLVEEQAVKKVF